MKSREYITYIVKYTNRITEKIDHISMMTAQNLVDVKNRAFSKYGEPSDNEAINILPISNHIVLDLNTRAIELT